MSLTVVRPGLLTTVQDLGRHGWAAFGVPPAGAMDGLALRAANRLVGNDDGAAGLEVTLAGPELGFEADAVVAFAGSRFEARIGGREAPHLEAFVVRKGELVAIGRTLEGARGYLAVRGGIDVPRVLGSRATCLAAGFGGHEGRALRAGDRLAIATAPETSRPRRLAPGSLPPYLPERELRVILGPQAEAFTEAGREAFLSSWYVVSSRSDRMGLRLEGARIEHAGPADLAPEGLVAGAIQVPADGQPILLGADRPTTGGYTKIATVISADLAFVAQAKPGDGMRFAEVAIDEARRLAREREQRLSDGLETIP